MAVTLFRKKAPTVVAGPCVLENVDLAVEIAGKLAEVVSGADVPLVFKASFDKANRLSLGSYRGPGIDAGLNMLAEVKRQVGIPVLTDIHEAAQADAVAEVVDVIQIPAFLCRQTDLILAAARTGKPVNLKKGQFMSPWNMKGSIEKARSGSSPLVMVTERGTSFGYNQLVVDLRSLSWLRELGVPVIMDVTHSLQVPGGLGGSSGGHREFIPNLARAAAAWGCDGLFFEVHPDPDHSPSDSLNTLPLQDFAGVFQQVLRIWEITRELSAKES
jgi:2-dehydro-3-deoxyphosphooctonate aldolase (KDO 8-P synthase)